MEKVVDVMISVFFVDDEVGKFSDLEFQTTLGKAEELFQNLAASKHEGFYRIGPNLVNLDLVKCIKFDILEDDSGVEYDDEN